MIEVKIYPEDYPEDWNFSPTFWEIWVVSKLKEAGIPINGTLLFRNIESGTLIRYDDPTDFGVITYIWESAAYSPVEGKDDEHMV